MDLQPLLQHYHISTHKLLHINKCYSRIIFYSNVLTSHYLTSFTFYPLKVTSQNHVNTSTGHFSVLVQPIPTNLVSLILFPHNGCSIIQENSVPYMLLHSSHVQESYRVSVTTRKLPYARGMCKQQSQNHETAVGTRENTDDKSLLNYIRSDRRHTSAK